MVAFRISFQLRLLFLVLLNTAMSNVALEFSKHTKSLICTSKSVLEDNVCCGGDCIVSRATIVKRCGQSSAFGDGESVLLTALLN